MRKSEALSLTEKNMLDYFNTHDLKYVAEDAVFRNLSNGEVYRGRAEIGATMHYFYHVGFDARAELKNHIITEDKAIMEAVIRGKHIGEIEGIPPTGKEVNVPMVVTYFLQDGLIREAHIYMMTDVLLQQLGVRQGAFNVKTTYLVRDIFHLKFGQYRAAKKLVDEMADKGLMSPSQQARIFTDFTGDAYRLIFEMGFDSLSDYETSLTSELKAAEWQAWYEQFKPLVERSHREILKQVL